MRALRMARNDVQNACDLLLSGAPLPEPTLPTVSTAGRASTLLRSFYCALNLIAYTGGGTPAVAGAAGTTAQAAPATDPGREATALMNDLINRMQQQTTDPQAQFEWVVQQTQVRRSSLDSSTDVHVDLVTSFVSCFSSSSEFDLSCKQDPICLPRCLLSWAAPIHSSTSSSHRIRQSSWNG